MKNGVIFVLFIVIVLNVRCTSSTGGKSIEIDPLSIAWAKDSIGCSQLRTQKLANELINKNKLINNTKEEFLKVFHSPNKIEHTKDSEILIYYFDNMCEIGNSIPNSDKCYARFYLKANKLIETDFICE